MILRIAARLTDDMIRYCCPNHGLNGLHRHWQGHFAKDTCLYVATILMNIGSQVILWYVREK